MFGRTNVSQSSDLQNGEDHAFVYKMVALLSTFVIICLQNGGPPLIQTQQQNKSFKKRTEEYGTGLKRMIRFDSL